MEYSEVEIVVLQSRISNPDSASTAKSIITKKEIHELASSWP